MARIIDGNNMNMVGDIIRKYRKKRNMSQQLLSARLELAGVYICRGSISRIEDKSRTVTDIELNALINVLEIPIDEIFISNRIGGEK